MPGRSDPHPTKKMVSVASEDCALACFSVLEFTFSPSSTLNHLASTYYTTCLDGECKRLRVQRREYNPPIKPLTDVFTLDDNVDCVTRATHDWDFTLVASELNVSGLPLVKGKLSILAGSILTLSTRVGDGVVVHGAEVFHFAAIDEDRGARGMEGGAEGAVLHFQHFVDAFLLFADPGARARPPSGPWRGSPSRFGWGPAGRYPALRRYVGSRLAERRSGPVGRSLFSAGGCLRQSRSCSGSR
jgi:hypothetical protein